MPWDQQEDETAKAFAAFVAYRSLPAQSRSIDTAWRRTVSLDGGDPGDKRAPATWRDWSAKYAWVARAAEWDAEKDRQAQQSQIDEHKQMLERHATIGQGLIAKAVQAMQGIPASELEAHDVGNWIRVGTELERKSRLIPDQIVEHRGRVAHEGSVNLEHSQSSSYDALVELLLHGPAEAIRNADRVSGRLAADSSLLGSNGHEPSRGTGAVEASPTP